MGSILPGGGTNYALLTAFIAVALIAVCALVALVLRMRHQARRVADLEQRFSASERPPTSD